MQLNRRLDTPCLPRSPEKVDDGLAVDSATARVPREPFGSRFGQVLTFLWRGFLGRRVDPDRFVDQVGHEIKTPLTSIRSLSEILRDNPNLPPRMREQYLKIILNESCRLETVLAVLLEGLSQPSTMQHPKTMEALLERMASAAQCARRQAIANQPIQH